MDAVRRVCGALWLVTLLAVATPTWAQPDELPSEPMLRINAPSHIAALRCIATDAAERFAVTASEDKTVRVWSLPNGALQRVIWLPSGDGDLGKAYSVALSPDGSTIAVGGSTGPPGHDNVFLFDRASGALEHRLSGLPNVVFHLTFSPDGKRLAAALGGSNGIRVFDATNGYLPLPSDSNYGDNTWWVDFDHADRLVSASNDGFVRLYGADKYDKPILPKANVPRVKRPSSVAFSPDGKHIAVGDDDSATVAVLVDRDLSPETFPVVSNFGATEITVAWSQDGQQLFAEGYDLRNFHRLARRWAKAGTGSFVDIDGTRALVEQFVPLRDRQMLFADVNGFGLIDATGNVRRLQDLGSIDLSNSRTGIRISSDARTVQVIDFTSDRTLQFALGRRVVVISPAEDTALAGPITQSERIKVTDWKNNTAPKLNGAQLGLYRDEMSRGLALVPGTDRFVLGADWSLRLFDASGKEVWPAPRPVPGTVWGINVSADGKLLVAAYADGTIRWHRVSDGAELLALFIHPDGKRWVTWTPQGYYDASAGADDLIGWQVNHGYDKAPDYFPASQFQQRFNRRDVIARVLDTLDVDTAVEEANKAASLPGTKAIPLVTSALTPVVEIKDPAADSDQTNRDFSLTYVARMTTPDPIERVEALVDGVPVKAQDVLILPEADKRVGSLRFTLPLRDAKVSVIAYNVNGASAPASVTVHWKGPGREDKATLYVLAIGVTHYKATGLPAVHFPAKDAQDFVALAKQQQGGPLYGRVLTWPAHESLEDTEATHDNILDGLDWIQHAVQTSNDVAMIFLSGHGVNDTQQHYRFLPYDYDPSHLERTTIPDTEFQQYFANIHGKILFFFDSCFSGNVLGGKAAGMAPDVDRFANELRLAKNGVVVFASSTGDELSLEPPQTRDEALQNGAFTWAVLEGLRGQAARQGVDVISLTDLNSYVARMVPDQTFGKQHPTFAMPKTVQDYPIVAVVR